MDYELLEGRVFASDASGILDEAWPAPAISYTPDYLKWQFGFPGPFPLRAVMAFEAGAPAGFAGATWRRMRCGSVESDVALVSFVAVRPAFRGHGVAAELYRHLLGSIRALDVPVVTFAIAGSPGEKILLRAYADAGFKVRPLGSYPGYAFFASQKPDFTPPPTLALPEIHDPNILWSAPSSDQMRHYMKDPRSRALVSTPAGAAWAVRLDIRTTSGYDAVTALDTVWLPRTESPAPLKELALQAAAWDPRPTPVISLPSLYGFEAAELRKLGIRQTGTPFHGYFCEAGTPRFPDTFHGTNLEIA